VVLGLQLILDKSQKVKVQEVLDSGKGQRGQETERGSSRAACLGVRTILKVLPRKEKRKGARAYAG